MHVDLLAIGGQVSREVILIATCEAFRRRSSHSLLQERARKLRRSSSGSPSGTSCSTSACVRFQAGSAPASSSLPWLVICKMRLLLSTGSCDNLTSPRRSSGFRAAVTVVRSIARSDAIGPMAGGSGRFSDMRSENCPLVSPKGRSASSKRRARARAARCTCRQRQRSRTKIVVSYGSAFSLDTRRG